MTLSRRPAQLLPVQVRPVGGETVVSYVFRLADANGFARPTMLLRAIGEPVARNVHAGILDHHDITLNTPALARLAALTGRSTASLRKTLPSLATPRADRRLSGKTEPLISAFSSSAIRGHCQQCIVRIPGHPNIRVHRRSAPAICRRHHRWVDTTRQHPNQVDLSKNIEIITAHRRFERLLSTVDELTWARQQLWRTTGIVTEWHHHWDRQSFSHSIFEHLHARWDKRAETLPSPGSATSLLVMPEAVALTEILCDLEWRRHVAMANDYDLIQFYRLVAQRLGQSTKFSDRLAYSYRIDPLKSWVIEYRKQFRTIRDQHWRRVRTHHPYSPLFPDAILPTIRHFK
jgi:hypothetical protein